MRKAKTTSGKTSNQTALKSLAVGISKLLAQTGNPIPAAKLEPLIVQGVKLGDGFVDKFTDELAEKLAVKLAEKVEDKLAGKVAEIRFPRG